MNLIDASVTKLLSDPYLAYGKWWIKVSYKAWSDEECETNIMFESKEDAEKVTVGYVFQI